MRTRDELRSATNPDKVSLSGALRRMAITATTKVLWRLAGVRMPDGQEARDVEPFTGIGFFSRPSSSGAPEAIVVMVGDANSPAIVATRDEATRAKSAGDLAEDETAIFNTTARVRVTAAGQVEIVAIGGVSEAMLKGATYRAAEDTLFTGLNTFVAAAGVFNAAVAAAVPALAVGGLTSPIGVFGAALTVFEGLIAAFQTGAPTYLATVGKVQ